MNKLLIELYSNNYNEIKKWVKQTEWAEFVLTEEYREFRSPINSCIKIKI